MQHFRRTPLHPDNPGIYKESCGRISWSDRINALVLCLIGLYAFIMSWASIIRHTGFWSEFDLGIFAQSLWTTLNGQFFYNSFEGMSHFGMHNSPILFTLLPLYFIFPDPQILLVIQSIFLGLGGLPVFLISRKVFNERVGVCFLVLYLMYPALHGANLNNFYELAFLPFLIGMSFYYLISGRYVPYTLFSLAALLVREDVALLVGMLALWAIWRCYREHRPISLFMPMLVGISAFWVVFSVFIVIPHFNPAGFIHASYYSSSFLQTIQAFPFEKVTYLSQLFLPLGLLSLFAPEILIIAVPSILELVLSDRALFFYINMHYSALLVTFIFIAGIYGIKRVSSFLTGRNWGDLRFLLELCFVLTIMCNLLFSPFIGWTALNQIHDGDDVMAEVIRIVPENAAILTQSNIAPHLANRQRVYISYHDEAEYILINENKHYMGDSIYENYIQDPSMKQKIDTDFDILFNRSGVLLYQRKSHLL